MHTVDLNAIELLEAYHEGDPEAQWAATFPLFAALGTKGLAVVYFEIEPGHYLGTHTDSAEEVVTVLEGEVVASLNGETGRLSAGQMVLIPAMAPHGIRNVGSTKARCVGVFASADLVSTFESPIMPMGFKAFDSAVHGAALVGNPGGGS